MAGLKFIGKVVLFLSPLIILLGLPLLAIYRSGEFLSYEAIAERMESPAPAIMGLTFSSPTYYISLTSVLNKKPDVLVLGSSRVAQIRSTFFKSGVSEYTASPVVQQVPQFDEFFQKIPPNDSPKLLIIGLDQKFFDPNYDTSAFGTADIGPLLTDPAAPISDILGNWWPSWFSTYYYFFSGKFPISELLHPNNSRIGISAVVYGIGERNDGSYDDGETLYPPAIEDSSLSDINWGVHGFEYSNTISQTSLDQLDSFLSECHARNIYVIGYMPPFSSAIYDKLLSLPDKYGYLKLLAPNIDPIFKKYGFDFYNFTDPKSVGITQNEMSNSLHATERGTLVYFVKMVEQNPELQRYADAKSLEQALRATSSQINVLQN